MLSYEEILKTFNQSQQSNFEKSPRVKNYTKVGFWISNDPFGICNDEISFSHPIENSAKEDNSKLIKKLLEIQNKAHVNSYFGCSTCRICNEDNGCSEYTYGTFIWPEGYIHYIRDHNVEINEEFKEFLQRV